MEIIALSYYNPKAIFCQGFYGVFTKIVKNKQIKQRLTMRIDKFLKVSRILKRRSVANDACSGGRVEVNGKSVKPAYNLKVGDEVLIAFGEGSLKFRVLNLKETVRKDEAASLYEIIND